MTEGSSKGLTWGTLVAGVVSAFALAAIGCVKPLAARDSAGPLGSSQSGSPDAHAAPASFSSRESAQRARDNHSSPARQ